MRAFPCTVRNLSPIQCLTGRIPKVDGFIELQNNTSLENEGRHSFVNNNSNNNQ